MRSALKQLAGGRRDPGRRSGVSAAICALATVLGAPGAACADDPSAIDWDYWATGSYQDLVDGDGSDASSSAARVDLKFRADTAGIGLWQGGSINGHLVHRDGNTRAFRGGALLPVDSAGLLPLGSKGSPVATSLYVGQRLGDSTMLLAGKIDAVDLLAAHPFFGGWGTDRFMHIAFVAPPSGVVPPVFIGGVLTHAFPSVKLTAMVFDPGDQTRNYALGGLFDDGVNVSLGLSSSGKFADRPTTFGATATYSTADGRDWEDIGLPPGTATTPREGLWNIAAEGSIVLFENGLVPGQGLGAYAKLARADGNPNAIRSSLVAGIAGYGMIEGRPADSFGAGYFYYDFSDVLQNEVAGVLEFDDESGIEAFYTVQATDWLQVTANLQWIDPVDGDNSTALVAGLRVRIAP